LWRLQADTVLDVTFVDGKGKVVTLNRTHPDFKALNGGLGLLGVMTEMTIQMTPPTNTQLITWYNVNDNNIITDIPKMLKVGVGKVEGGVGCSRSRQQAAGSSISTRNMKYTLQGWWRWLLECGISSTHVPFQACSSAASSQPHLTSCRRTVTTLAALLVLQIAPHILIFWRPDVGKYSAYITRKAAPGLKPNPDAVMTLLPNVLDQGPQPNVKSIFAQLQYKLPDDPDTMGVLCPVQGPRSIESFAWATVKGKAAHNVTGFTNKMQASECDGHCLWNDQTIGNGTAQVRRLKGTGCDSGHGMFAYTHRQLNITNTNNTNSTKCLEFLWILLTPPLPPPAALCPLLPLLRT
jgi:hypothetical protein